MRGENYESFPNDKYPEHEPSAQHEPNAGPPDMSSFCDMEDYLQALESWRQSEAYDITKDDGHIAKLLREAKYNKGAYDLLKKLGYAVDKKEGGAR